MTPNTLAAPVRLNLTEPFPLQSIASHLITERRKAPLVAAAIKLTGARLLGSYATQITKLNSLEKPPVALILNALVLCLLAQVNVVVVVEGEEINLVSDETLAVQAEAPDVDHYIDRARQAVVHRLFRTPAE